MRRILLITRRSTLCPLLLSAMLFSITPDARAQQSTPYETRDVEPGTVTLTEPEAREVTRTLADCETVAGDLKDSRQETKLEHERADSATAAAESYKRAAELQDQRANAQEVLTHQARDALRDSERKGKKRALKVLAFATGGASIGATGGPMGAAIGAAIGGLLGIFR